MVEFVDIAPVSSSIIMVVGVGGGGSNAVNHMFKLGIADVSFMVCNTDRQALGRSPIPTQVRLGETLTQGLGAGNRPERGRAAAEESIEEIKEIFREKNIKMVFVTAGMGGGTGTGAAPVIAKAAKEMGILTVAIVTIPFKTEGPKRIMQALDGIEEIRHNVDSLLVVNNENINEIYGDLTLSEAFGKADDILASAAKSIADIITQENRVNLDFADVQTVMKDSGIALMGSAQGSGEDRARKVAEAAMNSPLLNHRDITGAKNVLMTITSGSKEVRMTETYEITQFVQDKTGLGLGTDLIWGAGTDMSLGDDIRITIVATGFDIDSIPMIRDRYAEVVGRDFGPERRGAGSDGRPGSHGIGGQQQPPRQTIDLVDLDGPAAKNTKSKDRDGFGGDGDFAVVTHVDEEPVPILPQVQAQTPVAPPVDTFEQQQVVGKEEIRSDFVETETTPEVEAKEEGETGGAVAEKGGSDNWGGTPPVTALSEEELENIPAYIRRRMKIEAETLPAGSKVSRETLKNDSVGRRKDGGHLFD